MNLKSLALATALATGLVAPAFADIVPASYLTGVVTAVNAQQGTLTVDGKTFTARAADLVGVSAGEEVDIAYVTVLGQLQAIAVDPIAESNDDLAE